MKKLGKKISIKENSLVSYTCWCAYSSCSCSCPDDFSASFDHGSSSYNNGPDSDSVQN